MKNIGSILFATVLFFSGFSQSNSIVDVKWGAEVKIPNGEYQGSFAFQGDITISVWQDGSDLLLVKSGPELEELDRKELAIENEKVKGKVFYVKTVRLKEKLIVISKVQNKDENKYDYFAQVLDFESLTFKEEASFLGDMTMLNNEKLMVEDIIVDEENTHMLFAHTDGSSDISEFWYELSILNSDLTELYTDEVVTDADDLMELGGLTVGPEGKFAFKSVTFVKSEFVYPYRIKKSYLANLVVGPKRTPVALNFEGRYVVDFAMFFDRAGKLNILGFHSNISAHKSTGYFSAQVGERNRLVDINFDEFSNADLKKYGFEGALKQGEKPSMDDIRIHNLEKHQGGYTIIAEHYWPEIFIDQKELATDIEYDIKVGYHLADILVLDMHSDLSFQWLARIPKNDFNEVVYSTQNAHWAGELGYGFFNTSVFETNTDQSSIKYHMIGEDLYIMYNDHRKNHTAIDEKNILKTSEVAEDFVTCVARVDKLGGVKRAIAYPAADINHKTYPRKCAFTPGNQRFTLMTYQKKSIKPGSLIFK